MERAITTPQKPAGSAILGLTGVIIRQLIADTWVSWAMAATLVYLGGYWVYVQNADPADRAHLGIVFLMLFIPAAFSGLWGRSLVWSHLGVPQSIVHRSEIIVAVAYGVFVAGLLASFGPQPAHSVTELFAIQPATTVATSSQWFTIVLACGVLGFTVQYCSSRVLPPAQLATNKQALAMLAIFGLPLGFWLTAKVISDLPAVAFTCGSAIALAWYARTPAEQQQVPNKDREWWPWAQVPLARRWRITTSIASIGMVLTTVIAVQWPTQLLPLTDLGLPASAAAPTHFWTVYFLAALIIGAWTPLMTLGGEAEVWVSAGWSRTTIVRTTIWMLLLNAAVVFGVASLAKLFAPEWSLLLPLGLAATVLAIGCGQIVALLYWGASTERYWRVVVFPLAFVAVPLAIGLSVFSITAPTFLVLTGCVISLTGTAFLVWQLPTARRSTTTLEVLS